MTKEELDEVATLLYGQTWRKAVHEAFGISRMHLQRVMAGKYPVPEGIRAKLEIALMERQVRLNEWAGRLARG